ncbi:DMT family transporter [Arsenicicoccus sp. oral taxon 190]|uniref:DMT family transporter n=1 Tax=Arsenicicoccus sp. oral taxon 190 TaxID=1658671 RepID=UPI000679EC67|nr:DMT family transporter [Arsenicicoccus sp. oral taxon 190]AKT51083.1 hypothetical protein ADJ73_06680 [Arsenicicoccus sp. oral taxon 190]
MVAIAYALVSAVLYGVSDFLSGVQSRRRHFLLVAAVAQTFSAVGITAVALAQRQPLTQTAVLWGAVAATGHCSGTLMLMRGLARGAMHVAGPLSAVCAAGLPVLLGVALGERPTALGLVGILLALPAVWAVAAGESEPGSVPGEAHLVDPDQPRMPPAHRPDPHAGVRDGLLAGVGFAVFFIALARAGSGSGSWPVAVCQLVSLAAMWLLVARARPAGSVRAALPAWVVGVTGSLGSLTYFLAGAAGGGLTVVPVVASLYPAFTVLLAMLVLAERASRTQVAGLVGCALAVALIAANG